MKSNLTIIERRDDLDFLKAIAIIFVVLYHTYVLFSSVQNDLFNHFKFGFLGVDIFFVISGYLICKSVLPKIVENNFSFKAFISRRYFRIVPPLLIVCLVSILVGYFFLYPNVFQELVKEAFNAVLFIGNFRLIGGSGYFGIAATEKVLLHTWYLAITFQFYVLFPLLLLFSKKIFGVNNLNKAIFALTVILIAIAYFLSLDGNGYLKTECRIWELFVGSLLYSNQTAITRLYKHFKIPTTFFSILATGLIVYSILCCNSKYGNWYVTSSIFVVVLTCIFISCKSEAILYRNSLFNFIGKSSYSIYLWHWPLLIFLLRTKLTSLEFYYILNFVIILVFSSITYFFCERKKYPLPVTLVMLVALTTIYGIYHKNDCKNYISSLNSLPKYEYQNKETLNTIKKQLDNNLSVLEYTKDHKTPRCFWIGDSHTAMFNDYLLHQTTPVYVYYNPATMAYGSYFANMKNVVYEKDKARFPLFYNTYKETLKILKTDDAVVITNFWLFYKPQYLQENQLEDNDSSTELYIDAIISDLDEQIKLYPHLNFFIVGNGVFISDAVNSYAKLDLSNSFLRYFVNSSNTAALQKDLLNDFNNLFIKKVQAYASKRQNVYVIDRRNALKGSDNSYYIIKNNYSLFMDSHHNHSYGAMLVGSYIFDEVKKQLKQRIDK